MGGVQKRRTLIVSILESFYGTNSNNGLALATGTFIPLFYFSLFDSLFLWKAIALPVIIWIVLEIVLISKLKFTKRKFIRSVNGISLIFID